MSDVVTENELVHVATRRTFAEEPKRHFAGRVVAVAGNLAAVEGYAFIFSSSRNEFQKRPELRKRVFSLIDAGNVINILPPSVNLEALRYAFDKGRLSITDGAGYSLDVNEYGPHS